MKLRVTVAIAAMLVSALAFSSAGADPRDHRGGGWRGGGGGHNWNGGGGHWQGGGGHNWGGGSWYRPHYSDPGTAFWGGVVGGALGNLFHPDPPPVIIEQAPVVVVPERTPEWCEAHYRSYNLETGMFTGYDGVQRPCP